MHKFAHILRLGIKELTSLRHDSVLLLFLFYACKFNKQNKFAVNLLLIQFLFFLILRTFLIK